MTLQSPKAVVFEGRGGGATAQIAARAKKKARFITAGTTTGNVILPVSSNTKPFAVMALTNLGTDAVYWALGTSDAIAVDHVVNEFDDVLAGGQTREIAIGATDTHIAAITVSGTAVFVIVGLV